MPILTLTLRGEELKKETIALLERPYKFSKLKLQHVYHNIDSTNFKNSVDKEQQCLLFIKLGGLVDSAKQVINYFGDFSTTETHVVQRRFNKVDSQSGQGTLSSSSASSYDADYKQQSIRREPAIEINHLIPIGPCRHNSKDIVSRDLFKQLHDGDPIHFDGELNFSLFYMDHEGNIKEIDDTTGGIDVPSAKGSKHISYLSMVFEYDEIPM